MTYEIEHLAQELKSARQAKGMSQRALSKATQLPQSHISKIENGTVDLRLSSLVVIARVLELELVLVPRHALPAVQSITRVQTSGRGHMIDSARTYRKVEEELTRLEKNLDRISETKDGLEDLPHVQRALRDLRFFPLHNDALNSIREANKTIEGLLKNPNKLAALAEATRQVQILRNRLAHSQVEPENTDQAQPAYSLDTDDHD